MQSGIYQIRNTENGKRYVGSAANREKRFNEHRSMLCRGRHHSGHLQNAFHKYGAGVFVFETLLICAPQDLLFYEQRAINGLCPEYNVARVAGNTLGTRRSQETKAKIAAKALGRTWSDDRKAKLSAAMTGRKMSEQFRQTLIGNQRAKGHRHTDEWKAANSVRMLGQKRPKSPEHREKIAASLRGRKASAQARANQSAAQLGRKRGPYRLRREVA
jgi:group I intron endonuclease